jgi:quinol monooxygenase YgiN
MSIHGTCLATQEIAIVPPRKQQAEYVLIVHEIENYGRWKAIFDGAATMRREAGEIEYRLFAFDADDNQVVHFSRWSSLTAARAFFESPELVEIRHAAGVRAPRFLYLKEIAAGKL